MLYMYNISQFNGKAYKCHGLLYIFAGHCHLDIKVKVDFHGSRFFYTNLHNNASIIKFEHTCHFM